MQGFTTPINDPITRETLRSYFRILLVALFAFNDSRLIAAIFEKDSIPILFFVTAYVTAYFSVCLLLLSKSNSIRTLTQILLFSCIYTDAVYIILGGLPFSYPDAINLFNNPEYASNAIITFKTTFLLAFAGAGVVFTLVQLSLKEVTLSYAPAYLFLFITMQVFFYLYSKQHPGTYDFLPSVYRVTGNLLTANSFDPEEQWRRAGVTEKPGKIHVKHLFIVVDESITGNILSLNGFPLSTSPYLKSNAEKFINFGIATSFTNFSAGSNLSLMSGMLLSELPDKKYISFSKTSIFQYAKNAGYQTYLLDAQSDDKLQNYTTSRDLFYIDSLFHPGLIQPPVASYSRDSIIAEKIASIAKLKVPTFVYVNKAGAHWPYNANFPQDSLNNYFSTSGYRKRKNGITYLKSLFWNVDKFWERLTMKLPENSNVLILYTSDHGENYASNSTRIKHASIYNTLAIEGMVPLLVFDQANFFPKNFSPRMNRYSHQYIFPTLLHAMGYDKNFIQTKYGRTLLEPPYPQSRWFQTGDLFGRGKNTRIFVD